MSENVFVKVLLFLLFVSCDDWRKKKLLELWEKAN